jgi:hypothetical protein
MRLFSLLVVVDPLLVVVDPLDTVMTDLELHPLWLLMSISYHAGLYNPMMGYAENASWWHQVPPFMEALMTYEIAVALDDDHVHKTGKIVDRRAGNDAMGCLLYA